MQKNVFALLAILMAGVPLRAYAAGPQPPCGGTASLPAFPALGTAPSIAIFHASDLATWRPSACTEWPPDFATHARLVIAVAGRFRFAGPIDQLVGRVAAVSTLRNVRYWSTTDKQWRPLAYDASALTGPDPKSRRSDFTATELNSGAVHHYWESDSRSGEVIMRLSVREHTADTAVIETENVTPIRRFLVTLFPPGSLQTVLVIKRLSPDNWGAYLLSLTSDNSSFLAGGHEASYANRAVALYRQIAGIQTNAEPPAIR